SLCGGPRQPWSLGPVRNHQDDFSGVIWITSGLDERHHVGAATGDQDGDVLPAHGSPVGAGLAKVNSPTTRSASAEPLPFAWLFCPSPVASSPMMRGVSPWARRCAMTASAWAFSTIRTRPIPALKVRNSSG